LLAERDGEWDASEVPQLYFNRVEKAIQGLTRAGINSDLNERRDMALYYMKASGEFDAAVREWENRPTVNKTWQNIKTFISAEHAKENKQNKLTAKNFKANMIEEQTEATEELIAALTEKHTQQIESLIKSNTEAMKQMMSLIKNDRKEPGDKNNQMRRRRRSGRNNDNDSTTHLFANTVARNTPPKKRMSVGNLRRTKLLGLPIGNRPRAPEGARGP